MPRALIVAALTLVAVVHAALSVRLNGRTRVVEQPA